MGSFNRTLAKRLFRAQGMPLVFFLVIDLKKQITALHVLLSVQFRSRLRDPKRVMFGSTHHGMICSSHEIEGMICSHEIEGCGGH